MNKQFTSRKLLAGLMLAAGFVCAPIAQAALGDLGNGVIKDTDLGIVWLADANNSKTSGYNTNGIMNWTAANTWVDQLNIGGHSDWHLPTTSEFSHLFSTELDGVTGQDIYATHNNANFALFSNIQSHYYSNHDLYWTSTPTGDVDKHSLFGFYGGQDFTGNKDTGHYAMAISSVPEPETYALLLAGLGLVGFIARRRKQRS
ncbi:MAG: DUF1566 domain-containing protein [Nitrosospira sp.]